jgi:hypothetical protein
MEALAFVEQDIDCLLDTAVSFIPKDSVIYRMIATCAPGALDSRLARTRERIVGALWL